MGICAGMVDIPFFSIPHLWTSFWATSCPCAATKVELHILDDGGVAFNMAAIQSLCSVTLEAHKSKLLHV